MQIQGKGHGFRTKRRQGVTVRETGKKHVKRIQRIRSPLTKNRGRPGKRREEKFFDENWWNIFSKRKSLSSS